MLSGRELEEAVAPVVAAILGDSALGMRQFKVEPNKVVKPRGVPHEIDVYVTEEPGGEIYLFECKNQKRSVDANVVMLLKRKIDLIGAARGFIVARRFSANARTQAKFDGVELLDAVKHVISPVRLQTFSGFAQTVTVRNIVSDCGPLSITFDTHVRFEGVEMPFGKVAERFAKELVALRTAQPDALALPPGTHGIVGAAIVPITPGKLLVSGCSILSLEIVCPIEFTTQNPPIRYGYDIAAKHVVAKFERFQISENQWADTITLSGPGS